MNRFARAFASAFAIAVVAVAGCRDDTLTVTAKEPEGKSVRLSPRALTLAPNQSVDVQVILAGFAVGVTHECRLEPTTIGTVAAVPGACRISTGAPLVPGRLIVRVETLADTALVVVPAGR